MDRGSPLLLIIFIVLAGLPETGVVYISAHAWTGMYWPYHTISGSTAVYDYCSFFRIFESFAILLTYIKLAKLNSLALVSALVI